MRTLYVRVTVSGTGAVTGGDETDGRVNTEKLVYNPDFSAEELPNLGVNVPTDIENSISRVRANIRWESVLASLSEFYTINYLGDFTAPGGSIDDSPTSVAFTVGIEGSFDEFSTLDNIETVEKNGETSPGNVLTGENAIKRMIARALLGTHSMNRTGFNPDIHPKTGWSRGVYIDHFTAGPEDGDSLAAQEAKISAELIIL